MKKPLKPEADFRAWIKKAESDLSFRHMEQLTLYSDESYDRSRDKEYYCICGLLLSGYS